MRHRNPCLLIACAFVLAACSVSTPRGGWSQGAQAVDAGARANGRTTTSLAAGAAPGAASSALASGRDNGSPVSATSGGATGATPATLAAAAAPTVGVTDKTITISALAGFSGQYGPVIEQVYSNGFEVWVNDVNQHGGINGRQIVVKKVDHQDTVEGGINACKQIQGNGSYLVLSIVGLAGSDVAAVSCLDKAGITSITWNLSTYNPKWTHVYSIADPFKASEPVATFTRNVLNEKGKIGVIYIQNDPVNRASRDGFLAGLKELGVAPVHEETIASGQNQFVAEVNRMRSSGATTVALAANPNEALGVLRDAKAIGYTPKWASLFFWTSDEFAGAGRGLMAGIKAVRHYASTNSPAYQAYVDKANAQGKHGLINSTTMALYADGLVLGKVLQNAGPTPTAANLGPSIEALVNYDDGILHFSFGKGVHVAETGMWPIQCCTADNAWQGTGPPRTRF